MSAAPGVLTYVRPGASSADLSTRNPRDHVDRSPLGEVPTPARRRQAARDTRHRNLPSLLLLAGPREQSQHAAPGPPRRYPTRPLWADATLVAVARADCGRAGGDYGSVARSCAGAQEAAPHAARPSRRRRWLRWVCRAQRASLVECDLFDAKSACVGAWIERHSAKCRPPGDAKQAAQPRPTPKPAPLPPPEGPMLRSQRAAPHPPGTTRRDRNARHPTRALIRTRPFRGDATVVAVARADSGRVDGD